MSDQEHIELSAKQTPLPDLLDGVPDDIVLGIPGDKPMFPSYTNIPIGKLARQAAAELRRLDAENEMLWKEREEPHKIIDMYVRECNRLESERDALLGACKGLLNLFEQHEDRARIKSPVGDYARAVIKAVEEGK